MYYAMIGLLGLAAGVYSGLFGLGGAAIVVPALVLIFKFNQQTAQGTSLAMLLPPIGILAVMKYWQSGNIKITVAAVLAATFIIGAAIGAHYAVQIPEGLMKKLFGGALVALGLLMAFGK